MLANDTFAINLADDWTNATLDLITTQRPQDVPPAVNFGSLWWDEKRNILYQFGGEKSQLPQRDDVPVTDESIWGFIPNDSGSVIWSEYVGSTANTTWTQGIVRPSHGFSGSDGKNGYFFGGVASYFTDNYFTQLPFLIPGLLTFDFDSRLLENSTNVPDMSSQWVPNGQIVSIPIFGAQGVLVVLGGGSGAPNAGEEGNAAFNNITIFDIANNRWLWQLATGDTIPSRRNNFCAVGVQGSNHSTSEM